MGKGHTAEEGIHKLRQVEVELSKGNLIAGACKLVGISEQRQLGSEDVLERLAWLMATWGRRR